MSSIEVGLQDEDDYTWACGNDSAMSHVRVIDKGGGGEVHEASPILLIAQD